jgi:integrase
VPLSPLARSIIESQPRTGPFVFVMNSLVPICLGSRVKDRLDTMMGNPPPWRFHDLRRTAATGMAAIGIAPHVVEAVLNHVSGFRTGVGGTYNRHSYFNEKREALAQWEAHLLTLVGGER